MAMVGHSRSIFLVALALCLSACGGTKLIKEPEPLLLNQPLMQASNADLEVTVEWVIIRAGPGSWAKNADWDEYLLTVRNLSGADMNITSIAVYDALDVRMASNANRSGLVKESRKVQKRFKGEGIKVKAGIPGAALAGAGATASVVGVGVGMAALGGSATAASFAGAAVIGIVAAPVLAVGGAVRGVNNSRVNKEIMARSTSLPTALRLGEERSLDIFFPIAPSPKRVELTYLTSTGKNSLFVDTSSVLQGLHLENQVP
jgi:hypothetical protein